MKIRALHNVDSSSQYYQAMKTAVTAGQLKLQIHYFYSSEENTCIALEGSHRLAVANELGMDVEFIEVQEEDLVNGNLPDTFQEDPEFLIDMLKSLSTPAEERPVYYF